MALRRGIIYSVLFHLFLSLLFLLISCHLEVVPPEPMELGLSMLAEEGLLEEEEGASASLAPEKEGSDIPVKMPETKAPPIKGEEKSLKKDDILSKGIEDSLLSNIGKSGKELTPKLTTGDDEGKGVGGKKGVPYSITGALSKRKILKKVLPPYPAGYEERTDVQVKLTVGPAGEVKKLLLMKTGGAVFDNTTLEALREWRWEPLPPSIAQVDQEGIITFFYELK
jgi:outer membrane biosynthesis protein TonB